MRNNKILIISFLFLLFIVSPHNSFAAGANMSFSPSSGTYEVGDILSVDIVLSSNDKATNAVSGTITFPKDKLNIVSLSKSGSIISLWVLEPSFSNRVGTSNFEAIVLNPGFTGSNGKVITLKFRVKSSGDAHIDFSKGAALANDGVGTNILDGLGSANFTLVDAKERESEDTTTEPKDGETVVLASPIITKYSEKLHTGEYFVVEGETSLNTSVVINLQKEGGTLNSYRVDSDDDGSFILATDDELDAGTYMLWAEAVDEFGVISEPSDILTVIVSQITISKTVLSIVNIIQILIFPIAIIILLLILVLYVWHRRNVVKGRIDKGSHEVEHTVHDVFDSLIEDVNEQIDILEKTKTKRKLTEEEKKVSRRLKKSLKNAEKTINSKIKDIDKEIK